MDEPRPSKKPWYRARNIILILFVVLLVVFLWAWRETAKVYHGKPNIAVDYRLEYRRLASQAAGIEPNAAVDVWTALRETALKVDELRLDFEQRILDEGYEPRCERDDGTVDFAYVHLGAELSPAAEREITFIRLLRDEGIFDDLAEIARDSPGMYPASASGPLGADAYRDFTSWRAFRFLARARVASMRLALIDYDSHEVINAFRDTLAMAETVSFQPSLLGHFVAQSIAHVAERELRQELMEAELDAATCRELLATIGRHELAPFGLAVEAHRMHFYDIVQRTYTDDGEGDGYRLPWETIRLVKSWTPLASAPDANPSWLEAARARFVGDSRADIVGHFDDGLAQCLAQQDVLLLLPADPDLAAFSVSQVAGDSERDAVELELQSIRRFLQGKARQRSHIDATRLAIALALHRALHRSFPDSLTALAPDILPEIPLDAEFMRPFGYRLVTDDDGAQRYILYRYGPDRTDDGGRIFEADPMRPRRETAAGYDIPCTLPREPVPD